MLFKCDFSVLIVLFLMIAVVINLRRSNTLSIELLDVFLLVLSAWNQQKRSKYAVGGEGTEVCTFRSHPPQNQSLAHSWHTPFLLFFPLLYSPSNDFIEIFRRLTRWPSVRRGRSRYIEVVILKQDQWIGLFNTRSSVLTYFCAVWCSTVYQIQLSLVRRVAE